MRHPLRPIVSSRGSINYEVTKESTRILRPLVGNSPTTLRTLVTLYKKWKGLLYKPKNVLLHMMSLHYYICAHRSCYQHHQKKIRAGPRTPFKNNHEVEQIISLLGFCLKTTYFQFQGRFYEQLQGAAMGSPISPIVANLFLEDFETKAINTAQYPQTVCRALKIIKWWIHVSCHEHGDNDPSSSLEYILADIEKEEEDTLW